MFPSIGVDLVHLPRLTTLFSHRTTYIQRFARRILTPTELSTFSSLLATKSQFPIGTPLSPSSNIIRWLGVRWAANEAAFKAGGPRLWKEVEVNYLASGKPYLKVMEREGEREGGLSISHDGEYVVAMAMILQGGTVGMVIEQRAGMVGAGK